MSLTDYDTRPSGLYRILLCYESSTEDVCSGAGK